MAGRMITLLTLIISISTIFYLAGITSDNPNNTIKLVMEITNSGGALSTSEVWIRLLAAIAVVTGVATVTAFTFGNANAGTVIGASSLGIFLLSFITDFFHIITKAGEYNVNGWVYYLVWFIFMPIIFIFMWTIIEFVRGNE